MAARTRWQTAWDDWAECIGLTGPGAKVKAKKGDPPRVRAIAIDTETTGFEWTDEAFCATVAWEDIMGNVSGHYIPFPEGLDTLRELLLSARDLGTTWIFHNAGFDLKKLIQAGCLQRDDFDATTFIDTQCLAIYLDNLQPLKLKGTGRRNLVARYLKRNQTAEFERLKIEKARRGMKRDDGYHMLPAAVLVPYAIKDAQDTFCVWRELMRLGAQKFPAWKRMIDREMEVALALLDMETAGLAVDTDYLIEQRDVIGGKLMDAEQMVREMANQITGKTDWTPPSAKLKRARYEDQLSLDGVVPPERGRRQERPFNPASTEQLAAVLMALNYELGKTEKGAWQVDKQAIDRCALNHKHPFLDAITQFRRMAKLHGTYITGILSEEVDGVLHSSFRQYGTRTGRFSSGKENDE